MTKRLFDVAAAAAGLFFLSPLFLVVAALIKMDSAGPVFFRQERIGLGFRPFRIYKFRTMVQHAERSGPAITFGQDGRITRTGRMLRRTKLDELPQLLNVLRGEMSIVGPRPEVRRYVERFRDEFSEVLSVRPGITDLASIRFRDEAAILGASGDPEELYVTRVLPEKLSLAKAYAARTSLLFDLGVIVRTLAVVVMPRTYPRTSETP
jgi:lipopolysaccharide/colanic/teichoic acid biosynthesis glycosyltransferase